MAHLTSGTAGATVRYWAGARAAAGATEEQVAAGTLADVLQRVSEGRDARFAQVLSVCSFLVDGDPVGARDHAAVPVADGTLVDCLPPFAGG